MQDNIVLDPTLLIKKKKILSNSYDNRYQLKIATKSIKLRIINNRQIYSTIIDTMGQTFPVGILLLEETEVPEENHEPSESHRQT